MVARSSAQHHTAVFELLRREAGQDVGLQQRGQIGGQGVSGQRVMRGHAPLPLEDRKVVRDGADGIGR